MPFSPAAEDIMLDGLNGGTLTSVIAYGSLHSAYSSTGASELSGGSYARVALSADWSAASAAEKALGSQPSAFSVPGSTTALFAGFWSASSGGTFSGMGPLGAGSPFGFTSAAGTPSLYTAPNSTYPGSQTVVLFDSAGATISSDFTVGAVYYTVNVSGDTFNLATTSGGTGIASSHAGAGIVQSIAAETFGSPGTLQLTTATALYLY